jgi:DNA recombination protein RmuC
MEIFTTLLLLVLIVLMAFFLFRKPSGATANQQTELLIQQQKNMSDLLLQSIRTTTEQINQQMGSVTQAMQSTTNQLNQQLSSQTSSIGARLDNAARVIGELQKSQGQILQAGDEIKQLGQSMSKLEELLRAPKLRGGLGELMLEDLLKQVIPAPFYEAQYRFRNGNTVDAVIKTANGMIPIDSKFPLENFRKMVDAPTDPEKKSFFKLFVGDVKKHIDVIAQKYIVPDEGTFDFAIMYIPAENIYYETVIKNENFGDDNSLYNYATARRVFAVSPNTFYPQLQVIALGFKGMEVEKNTKEIIQKLSRLNGDLMRFTEDFETVGKHLTNASNKYSEAARRLDKFEEKLKLASGDSSDDGTRLEGTSSQKTLNKPQQASLLD